MVKDDIVRDRNGRRKLLQLTMAWTKMVLQRYQSHGWHLLKEMQESYHLFKYPDLLLHAWGMNHPDACVCMVN